MRAQHLNSDNSPDAIWRTITVAEPVSESGMKGERGDERRAGRIRRPSPLSAGDYQSSFAPNRMMVGPMIVTGKR
jgi:hypothetical protein